MTSDAKQEEWTGGEVLFAGGTDWAKVNVCITLAHTSARRWYCSGLVAYHGVRFSQIARGGSSKKQTDQEKMVSLAGCYHRASQALETVLALADVFCTSERRQRLSASSFTRISWDLFV